MFISDEEFVSRITSEDNLARSTSSRPFDSNLDHPLPEIPSLDIPSLLDIPPQDSGIPKSTRGERRQSGEYSGKGPRNLHNDVRAAIGTTASILGEHKAGRIHGISPASPAAYKRGHTTPSTIWGSLAKSPKEELLNKVIEGHSVVVDRCFDRLFKTLELMDDEKLEKVQNPIQLSIIAKNVSGIIAHAANSTKENVLDAREQQVHFHIMKPEMGSDKDYPTIEVSSAPSDPNSLPE